ncbi:hypothetical protein GALMADRAFT_1140791 [Galerina marginata CBS 339.88]|uniref:Uncharacterized protein n=1 Tax=Galerina marginata (strain CBS 339.88) TaxID=685588 RepID=A0A067SJ34_GALM3|nr:hypothetical protein GALMADRAFT_1140791 [Galerina marginata CBS 339.88]
MTSFLPASGLGLEERSADNFVAAYMWCYLQWSTRGSIMLSFIRRGMHSDQTTTYPQRSLPPPPTKLTFDLGLGLNPEYGTMTRYRQRGEVLRQGISLSNTIAGVDGHYGWRGIRR